MEYYKAVDLVCRCLRQTNAFYQSTTPWKHKNDRRLLDAIHHVVYESLRYNVKVRGMETLLSC